MKTVSLVEKIEQLCANTTQYLFMFVCMLYAYILHLIAIVVVDYYFLS